MYKRMLTVTLISYKNKIKIKILNYWKKIYLKSLVRSSIQIQNLFYMLVEKINMDNLVNLKIKKNMKKKNQEI